MKLLNKNLKHFMGLLVAFVMVLVAMMPIETKAATESPVVNGNEVTFYFESDASEMYLAGDMNGWSTSANPMTKDGNTFSITLTLAKGTYAYKFTDGTNWHADPLNENTKDDGFGGFNSVVEVTAGETATPGGDSSLVSPVIDGNEVTFYYASETATDVAVAGSFNNWDANNKMSASDGVFTYTIKLEAGSYQYKFVVDGNWMTDPANATTVDDGSGNTNSAFEVTATDYTGGDESGDATDTPDAGEVTYTVYAYSATEGRVSVDAAALWVWDLAGGGEGKEVTFSGTEEIDGKTWVKAEVKVAPTAELGLIFKALGSWDWQTSDLSYADAEGKGGTLYIVDGDSVIYTSVEDIEFAPAQTPADTEDKADTNTDKKEENDKKDEPTSGDDLTLVWVIVVVIIVAAAVVAVIVYKKLTAAPVAKDVDDDDDDDDEDEAVEEKIEE